MSDIKKYSQLIKDYIDNSYKKCFREPKGKLKHPFVVPGSVYSFQLWDWDSWLIGSALLKADKLDIESYQKGSILDFLDFQEKSGRIPICAMSEDNDMFDFKEGVETNIHKPCLAMQAIETIEKFGDFDWLDGKIEGFENYISWFDEHCLHESGLYFFLDDFAIGVDNDPCVFYRPQKSSGSIYLNCLMYNELLAMKKLEELFKRDGKALYYENKAEQLKMAINNECWDNRDGFFYTADLNLLPIDPNNWLHAGCPRAWKTLPMRIGVWTGFMPLWCKLATDEQAKRIVNEHFYNKDTFNSDYGIRSLSKAEKMYSINVSNNPSCWLGPIWIIANYMVFKGLLNYGYNKEAKDIAKKTIILLGQDIEKCGEMHEYYNPETGEGVHNQGFQSWNFLAYDMINFLNK